jgi:hypothetical protein
VLTVFSVLFPVGVFAVFCVFLWKRPFVLYSPRDFSRDTPVAQFVEAMQSAQSRQHVVFDSAIVAAVQETVANTGAGDETVVERAVSAARETIASHSIVVDIERINPIADDPEVEFFVDSSTTVQELLNFVYFAIAEFVAAYAYGTEWILRDSESGEVYDEIGTGWADRNLSDLRDGRTLAEAGLYPGARLEAVRPPAVGRG